MKTKSLSIFLVALFVVEMNLGAEENNNKNEEGEDFKYEIVKDDINVFDFNLKMILIGNIMVGKSALGEKICKNTFPKEYSPTVGFEFFKLKFRIVSDKKPVLKYQIWDCCGQEVYRSLVTSFYRNAEVCLLAYDVTNEESFKNIENWVNGVKLHKTEKHIHFVLIGTKIDLENERTVSKEDGENFAKKKGMKFVEVSAKTGDGIKDLEYILAKIIYEEFKKDEKKKKKEDESDEESDEIEIEDEIKVDYMMGEEPTHSSSLCDCCKKICENC